MALKLSDLFEASRLGTSLAGADLSHLNHRLADMTGVDLTGANLRGRYRPAVVAGDEAGVWTHFNDEFARLKWAQARFDGAILVDADLTWTNLKRGWLRGADLRGATVFEADMRDCNLNDADLRGADLTGSVMEGAILKGAVWDDATIWPEGFDPESR